MKKTRTKPIKTQAVIYIRVSSKRQVENMSLGEQRRICEEYCHKHNLDISDERIFEEKGESFFRQQEKEVLNTIKDQSAVISTGGGIILSQESQALLATFANVVFLEVDIDTLVERIKSDANNIRPLFLTHTPEAFKQIYTDRLPLYQKASTLIVTNRGKSIEELTNEIILKVGV